MTATGRFGRFGGRYVPESLVGALDELDEAWTALRVDPGFRTELRELNATFVGRPTPLHPAERLTGHHGGATIHLKREDLCHTGGHSLNSAAGQVALARRLGRRRIVTDTGGGRHGVATAAACARAGLPCVVYMGAADAARRPVDVHRMQLLGADVRTVAAGSAVLKDAVSEAIRDWAAHPGDTHYVVGSAIGPAPYPELVRDLQRVIGDEARAQALDLTGTLPDAVVACVGGGSNAIGLFSAFVDDAAVRLIGVEAGGTGRSRHAAAAGHGTPGVLHGSFSLVLQDDEGQLSPTHSIAAGLDYPGVGPELAQLATRGRASYVGVEDDDALAAATLCARLEGIVPAVESAHALHHAGRLAAQLGAGAHVLVCLSGRGDHDTFGAAGVA